MKDSIINEDNKTILIGLLSIIVVLWAILDAIPVFFASLFNTILGNLILLISVILVISKNIKYGILTAAIIIILFRFHSLSTPATVKENFSWSKDSISEFIELQDSINPKVIFDPKEIQKQASQEEVDYFLKNGMWPWSEEVEKLYEDAIVKNPYVRLYSKDSIIETKTKYNESIIKEILSWQTKEGKFLQSGVIIHDKNKDRDGLGSYSFNSGLETNNNTTLIKCGTNQDNQNVLQQTKYTGYDGILGAQTKDVTDIDYNNLENIIPNFKFVDKPCNPCVALNSSPDYSCPFVLDIPKNESGISQIWKYLWK
jgi:hypothetical protein